jgi:hypothetical protein
MRVETAGGISVAAIQFPRPRPSFPILQRAGESQDPIDAGLWNIGAAFTHER